VNDITQAVALVPTCEASAVVGDRGYDADAFIAHVERLGMRAVIPARSHRRVCRPLDRARYAERNVIERLFGRLKQYRRVATRYDKTADSYLGFVAAAGWLTALSGWPHGPACSGARVPR